ncbi:TlyA family rRNA (cytidine-2'-O)-methyltransferase [Thermus scotoductus]|uniref:TlyA family rRNA (Cytidine-2'-O)-methyltransferase n=1 Tax=Thermus scotoductus TaxID=37636 RepID=A0ABY0AH46_THESC|nr:TlyA family RNA methyltransferase [Thermus scotoductus]RTH16242.1 TlyA family rRNA (cytidine-2'-O)-methyltransferase [Thermus scotoductus]RTH31009.1 TlyA family rRNA (cytidine-2'-O)-methyltransferase [Thermus scotoductus]RTI06090.1 TlyA family rRNA (cytidine-2'-O)-methyltransferase [Thermus scotoductus]RTI12663.1 TlyA family rRNA (cytidine-2'-O)-methyltransferase [Thermus scotoductus]RTI22159.1 TlyA family rRNA (cytidine-2'-O)-methyltransferase [Thermus scotoductus]
MRLDRYLVERGLAESREKAQRLIQSGQVKVAGQVVTKPAHRVPDGARVELLLPERYVSRGAYKLLGALEAFAVKVEGKVAADLGASTGGFTQVLMERGVQRVYAVDVGKGQLHPRLKGDPRVVSLEEQDVRTLALPEPVDLVVMDVSFISSTLLLPKVREILKPGGEALILVKPQFELGPGVHKGVVRDEALRQKALARVREKALELGFQVLGETESPLPGKEGNREFWLWLGFILEEDRGLKP